VSIERIELEDPVITPVGLELEPPADIQRRREPGVQPPDTISTQPGTPTLKGHDRNYLKQPV
jgi:hypothetical protein